MFRGQIELALGKWAHSAQTLTESEQLNVDRGGSAHAHRWLILDGLLPSASADTRIFAERNLEPTLAALRICSPNNRSWRLCWQDAKPCSDLACFLLNGSARVGLSDGGGHHSRNQPPIRAKRE